jgi:hypothetical protein
LSEPSSNRVRAELCADETLNVTGRLN